MPTPEQIIPHIEGAVGFQLGSADGGSIQGHQVVADWVMLVKALLKTSSMRYLTNFQFALLDDVDETGNAITDATHLIAALIETVGTIATDGGGWVTFLDAASNTFDGTAALANTVVAAVSVVDVATTGVSQFTPLIFLAGAGDTGTHSYTGIVLPNTGLTVSIDGNDGGNPALNAFRVWVLYRA